VAQLAGGMLLSGLGIEVAFEASFPVVMEKALAGCPALRGRPVEVLNFGVSRYATTEALLTLRQDAMRFGPDLVTPPADDAWREAWRVTEGLLERMHREATQGRARFGCI
jgi:hypothetical protein